MDLLNLSNLSSNPLFQSLILLLSLFIWLKLAKGRNLNLSPSPPKLPIIGNIHQLGKLPHRALRDLSNKYGSLLLLRLGSNPTLVVSSVDMAREIVRSHDIAFSDRPRTTALNHLFYECKGMAFGPYDEEVEALIDKIRYASLKGEPINLTKMLTFVSSNIVSRCVFSHKIAEEDGCSKFGELVKRLMVLFTSFCFGDMFPYLSWADVLTGFVPSMKALSSDLDAFFDQCNMDDGSTPKASNPNAMKKVQQEVREVVANKSKVAPEDIHKMEYMKCVVKETLRLHPPAVFLPRKTSASVELGGYDIPSNTTEFINAWAIHRDPKWWEKPEEFIPERFDNSSIEFQGQDFHYIPFGMGRRGCPGMSFRVDLVEYVMANLLNWFDRKLPAGETAEKRSYLTWRLPFSEATSTTQSITSLNDLGGTSRYTSDLDQVELRLNSDNDGHAENNTHAILNGGDSTMVVDTRASIQIDREE
ncbi:hypothetical protein GQ457_15G016000 [Hibiscus cannabinus]